MGASHSREGNLDSDFSEDEEYYEEEESESEQEEQNTKANTPLKHEPSPAKSTRLEAKLEGLSLGSSSNHIKLYKHIVGYTPKAKWVLVDKMVSCEFVREGEEDEDDEEEEYGSYLKRKEDFRSWVLTLGSKIRARVDDYMQAKFFDDQMRVDFVCNGVWAMKFLSLEGYKDFVTEFKNCMFENTYLLEPSEENKVKVYGKDFLVWANPESADDSAWEDAKETLKEEVVDKELKEEVVDKELEQKYEEDAPSGIKSVTMGALDYSFLVSDNGIEAVKNYHHGIHGKGVAIKFKSGLLGDGSYSTPKKGLLMRSERDMILMSPAERGSQSVNQMDIETGKVVTEWKFEKDGTDISMRDMTNDAKGSQLDPSASTFMGLDDNRLCRWDMRDRHGVVQTNDAVLTWTEGHQFSRGTNFQCFATTGDGCVVVGSRDGKIRLYGTSSMRMAKTAFPGLGSPITHVDVTYDGRWIIGTTDTYLILISTVFTDKDGRVKTGFSGRMGNKIPAPRLLKLQPLDAYLAGKNKFHGGQFSWVTEAGKEERHIVASVGKFTVIWNFNQVKNSSHDCYKHQEGLKSCYCYKIVPKDESVVDSKFMHDKFSLMNSPEAPLVVATPKKVSSFSIA